MMNKKATGLTPEQALEQLDALYNQSVAALREAIGRYINEGVLPAPEARLKGLFVYPSLSGLLGRRSAQRAEDPRLGPLHSCGLLFHYHYAADVVPSLSAGTAHLAVSGLRCKHHR